MSAGEKHDTLADLGFDRNCLCPGCVFAAVEAQKYEPSERAELLREISAPEHFVADFTDGHRISAHLRELIARAGARLAVRQDEPTEQAMVLLVVAIHDMYEEDEVTSQARIHDRIDVAIRAFAGTEAS